MEMLRLTSDDIRILTAFRHDLHQNPELSGEEFRTTEKIREFLCVLPGCRIISMPVETGLIAQIPGTDAEIWSNTTWEDFRKSSWFLDGCDDASDRSYCDIYAKIDPESI